jgi:Family of unknown function (DUF6529)
MGKVVRRAPDRRAGTTPTGIAAPEGTATTLIVREPSPGSVTALAGAAAVGAALSLTLGFYGRYHTPTRMAIAPLQPSQMLAFKSALVTVAAVLAMFQLISAIGLYGRLGPGPVPRWLGPAHRWSGTVAFIASLPAAYHCLWSLGFQTTTSRVLVHSILGCAFYGAFATKMLALHSRRMPRWALPVMGGTLVSLLVAIWFTSAWWFYQR